jgi:hypothetical protein
MRLLLIPVLQVFSALSASLEKEADLQFAASMVQALNLILLTAPEVGPHSCVCKSGERSGGCFGTGVVVATHNRLVHKR